MLPSNKEPANHSFCPRHMKAEKFAYQIILDFGPQDVEFYQSQFPISVSLSQEGIVKEKTPVESTEVLQQPRIIIL